MRNMLKYLSVTSLVVLLTLGTEAVAQTPAKPPEPSGKVADLKITDQDYAIGPKDAKIVLIEYASLTCPNCAQFHTQVLSGLKKEFVDTGKIRYIYRDFPLDRLALAAAMIGRCAGRENFFGFIDTFYKAQEQWTGSSNPITALGKMARLGGMNQTKFDRCLKDVEIQNVILRQRLEAANDFKVQATPTVFVNGNRYSGGMTLDQFRTLLNGMAGK